MTRPQSAVTASLFFSSDVGSWEKLAVATEGDERDDGRYRRHSRVWLINSGPCSLAWLMGARHKLSCNNESYSLVAAPLDGFLCCLPLCFFLSRCRCAHMFLRLVFTQTQMCFLPLQKQHQHYTLDYTAVSELIDFPVPVSTGPAW